MILHQPPSAVEGYADGEHFQDPLVIRGLGNQFNEKDNMIVGDVKYKEKGVRLRVSSIGARAI